MSTLNVFLLIRSNWKPLSELVLYSDLVLSLKTIINSLNSSEIINHDFSLSFLANQMAHVTCGGCATTLMYPYGAQSVKCAVCQFVTVIGVCLLHLFVLSIWQQYFVHDDI